MLKLFRMLAPISTSKRGELRVMWTSPAHFTSEAVPSFSTSVRTPAGMTAANLVIPEREEKVAIFSCHFGKMSGPLLLV